MATREELLALGLSEEAVEAALEIERGSVEDRVREALSGIVQKFVKSLPERIAEEADDVSVEQVRASGLRVRFSLADNVVKVVGGNQTRVPNAHNHHVDRPIFVALTALQSIDEFDKGRLPFVRAQDGYLTFQNTWALARALGYSVDQMTRGHDKYQKAFATGAANALRNEFSVLEKGKGNMIGADDKAAPDLKPSNLIKFDEIK